jgi:hypothetical protein
MALTDAQLLAEVEDLLRTMPGRLDCQTPDIFSWIGRASAVIRMWDPSKEASFALNVDLIQSGMGDGNRKIQIIFHEARHDLRLKTVGPLTVAVDQGASFDYFDEVRKLIETAKSDLLFVDPYLDAEFVSRYLPHVAPNVRVRLLTRERLSTLLPRRRHLPPTAQIDNRGALRPRVPRSLRLCRRTLLLSLGRVVQRRREEGAHHTHSDR